MNNWNTIRAFYKRHEAEIFNEPANEWGMPAYTWCDVPGMLSMTPIEEWLWADIRAANVVMYPQYPVGRFLWILATRSPKWRLNAMAMLSTWIKPKMASAMRSWR